MQGTLTIGTPFSHSSMLLALNPGPRMRIHSMPAVWMEIMWMTASSEVMVIATELHLFELKVMIDIEADGCSLLKNGPEC